MQDGKNVILVVDDDPDILETMQVVLEANGYAFVGANGAEEGIKSFREHRPDAIIVDLMMEEIDSGTGLVTQLKAEGNTAPVFMLSSVGDDLNQEASYSDLGLSGVFQKPLDSKRLLAILATRLGG
ncbi:response regulator [bacterium]|nr:response regulator [bacterium]